MSEAHCHNCCASPCQCYRAPRKSASVVRRQAFQEAIGIVRKQADKLRPETFLHEREIWALDEAIDSLTTAMGGEGEE